MVVNPILVDTMDIPLPAGLIPSQPLLAYDSKVIPANSPLNTETILPRGMTFSNPFIIAARQPLRNGGDDQSEWQCRPHLDWPRDLGRTQPTNSVFQALHIGIVSVD